MASPRGSSFQADEVSSYFEIGVCPGSPPSYQQDSVSNNVPVCQNDIEQLVGCDETVIMTDSAVPEAKERLASQVCVPLLLANYSCLLRQSFLLTCMLAHFLECPYLS